MRDTELLKLLIVAAAGLSLVASLGACAVIAVSRRQRTSGGDRTFTWAVFWMCLSDACLSVCFLVNFLPPALGVQLYEEGDTTWRKHLCGGLGAAQTLAGVASVSWYGVICVMLVALLKGFPSIRLSSTQWLQHLFVWTVSLAAVAVPAFSHAFGPTPTQKENSECWIQDPHLYVVFYGPLIVYMLLALFTLVFFSIKLRVAAASRVSQVSELGRGTIIFIVVFVAVWAVPTADRAWAFVGGTPPTMLGELQKLCMSVTGIANAAVWFWIRHLKARPSRAQRSMLPYTNDTRTVASMFTVVLSSSQHTQYTHIYESEDEGGLTDTIPSRTVDQYPPTEREERESKSQLSRSLTWGGYSEDEPRGHV